MGKNILKFITNSNFDFKKAIKNYKFYNEILESNLFDEEFYRDTYLIKNEDPLTHYLTKGFKEGYIPSLEFDPDFYLDLYPDVKYEAINPLLHYMSHGRYENKKIQKAAATRRKEEIIRTNEMLLNNFEFEDEPLVSIIILNLNGLDHLKRLLSNFDKTTNYTNYEIIVVDNGSDDGSIDYLNSLKDIKIIKNNENKSFSKANNEAAKIANGEYLLLLNNDIEPTYGWLNELMGVMVNHKNVGAVGAKLIFPFYFDKDNKEKSFKIQHSGDIFAERMNPGCLYAINKSNKDLDIFDNSLNKLTKCICVTGAVMVVRKDVYLKFNGLDENYNYGLEDVDFCLNLYKNNYDVYYCGTSLLFHHESSTRANSKNYFENDNRNFKIFWNKWGGFLSKNLLKDKIHNKKFFTEKDLKITIFNDNSENNETVANLAQSYQHLGYEINVISDKDDNYMGNSTDILIRFSDNYSLENLVSRKDLVIVDINNSDVNILNNDYSILKQFKINKSTLDSDIIKNIDELLNTSDEFLWDLKID